MLLDSMEDIKEDPGSEEEEVFHEYLEKTAVEESEGMPLLRAARTGDLDSLQFLLAGDDIDVNQQDYVSNSLSVSDYKR